MVWDLEARCVIWQGDLGAFAATSVAVHLAAGRIVFCDRCSLMVWPLDEQRQRPFALDSACRVPTQDDCSVALSADGMHAASFGSCIRGVWNLEQRRCIGYAIECVRGRFVGISASADGRYAAAMLVQPDGLQLLQLAQGSEKYRAIAYLPGKHAWASFAVSADQRLVAATGPDARAGLQLWEVREKYDVRHTATLHGHVSPVRAVAVADDRRVVTVSGSSGGVTELQVWDWARDSLSWWQHLLRWLTATA